MADKYWKGGSGTTDDEKGSFNVDANWQTATGGDTTVPTSSDRIIFDKRAQVVPSDYDGTKHEIGKHYNCYYGETTNLTTFPDGPLDCQGLVISADFTGLVGVNSEGTESPLRLSLATGTQLIYRGQAAAYVTCKGGATESIPAVIHDCSAATGLLVISSLAADTEEWTKVEIFDNGTIEVEKDTKVVEIHNNGTATVIIGEGCPAIKLYAVGGSVVTDSPLAETENYGATVEFGSETAQMLMTAIDVTSLFQAGGSFTWRAPGSLLACEQKGGNIYVKGDGDKTLGQESEVIKLLGGTFDATGQVGSFVQGGATTKTKILVKGGLFKAPLGMQIDNWSM